MVVEVVRHLGFRGSGPASTVTEVIFDDFPVGAVFEETGAPRHGGLDDLISHHNKDVTWHGSIHPWWNTEEKVVISSRPNYILCRRI